MRGHTWWKKLKFTLGFLSDSLLVITSNYQSIFAPFFIITRSNSVSDSCWEKALYTIFILANLCWKIRTFFTEFLHLGFFLDFRNDHSMISVSFCLSDYRITVVEVYWCLVGVQVKNEYPTESLHSPTLALLWERSVLGDA